MHACESSGVTVPRLQLAVLVATDLESEIGDVIGFRAVDAAFRRCRWRLEALRARRAVFVGDLSAKCVELAWRTRVAVRAHLAASAARLAHGKRDGPGRRRL